MASKQKRHTIRRGKLPPSPDPYQPFPTDQLDVDQTRHEFAERWQERAERIKSRGVLPPEGWWFPADIKPPSPKAPASKRRRSSGRPPGSSHKYDWAAWEPCFYSIMDVQGDFKGGVPGWNCQADAERAILDRINSGKKEILPPPSTLRKHVGKWMKLWRSKHAKP